MRATSSSFECRNLDVNTAFLLGALTCNNLNASSLAISSLVVFNTSGVSVVIGTLELSPQSTVVSPNTDIQILDKLILAPHFYSSCLEDEEYTMVTAGIDYLNSSLTWECPWNECPFSTSDVNEYHPTIECSNASKTHCIVEAQPNMHASKDFTFKAPWLYDFAINRCFVDANGNYLAYPNPSPVPTIVTTISHLPTVSPVPSFTPTTPAPSAIPTPKPTTAAPTLVPTTPVPTPGPTMPPTPEPTPTPWYDTVDSDYLLGGAAFVGVTAAAAMAWLFKKRISRWPPLLRVATCGLSVMSVAIDALYCYAAASSPQFCSSCPTYDAPLITFLSFVICAVLLLQQLSRLKLAIDGETTYQRASFYALVMILTAHDGSMIVWLPWTETEATKKLYGYPDFSSIEFSGWCIVLRKIPMFVIQTQNLSSESNGTWQVDYASAALSGLILLYSLAQKIVLSLATRRMQLDVVVVTRDQVASHYVGSGGDGSRSSAGCSLVGATDRAAAFGKYDGDATTTVLPTGEELQSPLLPHSEGHPRSDAEQGAATPTAVDTFAAPLRSAQRQHQQQPKKQEPYIGNNSSDNCHAVKYLQSLLFVCLGAGLPVLIITGNLPSDDMVEKIVFSLAIGIIGIMVATAIFVCFFQGIQMSLSWRNREIVRRSFLETQKGALVTKEKEIEQQSARIEYINKQLEAQGITIEEFYCLSDAKAGYEESWRRLEAGDETAESDIQKWSDVLSAHPERAKEVRVVLMH